MNNETDFFVLYNHPSFLYDPVKDLFVAFSLYMRRDQFHSKIYFDLYHKKI